MSPPLVLITVATGHIGFAVLIAALKSGYRVCAAVRSPRKASIILSNSIVQSLHVPTSFFTTVTLHDLTIIGAYDLAVKDVDYIIHVASRIPSGGSNTQEDYHKNIIKPAVRGTLGILSSASQEPNMKRVVITSSAAGIIPYSTILRDMTASETANAESRTPNPTGPFDSELEAYAASKVVALNDAETWMKKHKPSFDLVHILPSGVMGRDDLVLSAEHAVSGTNTWIMGSVLGNKSERLLPGSTKYKIPPGSYVASSNNPRGSFEGTKLKEMNAIVAKLFPEAIEKGLFPNDGEQRSALNRIDAKKTEETFGWQLQGFEEQVKSVVGHYVELVSKV